MAGSGGRGCLQRRDAGVEGELRLGGKALARAENARQRRRGEKVDPTQLGERGIVFLGERLDLLGELLCLAQGKTEPFSQTANGLRALLSKRPVLGDGVGLHCLEPGLALQIRDMGAILRVNLKQELVDLVAESRRFGEGIVALSD